MWTTILELSCDFPQISRTVVSLARLSQVLRKIGPENAHGWAPNSENGLGFDFFVERYHKYGDEFHNYIVRVTGDETWLLFVNVETKKQSKQCMNTHSPNKPKTFQELLES
jgi:hypothetical protein